MVLNPYSSPQHSDDGRPGASIAVIVAILFGMAIILYSAYQIVRP